MKTIHFLVVLAALLASCAPTKSSVSTETDIRADTVRHELRRAQDAAVRTTQAVTNSQSEQISVRRGLQVESIPEQTASVTVTEESLRNLPDGASYTARDGRLTLEARRDGTALLITARSDSMARRIEYYEATSARHSRQVDSLKAQLAEVRRAYDRLNESSTSLQVQEHEVRTRSPARRATWLIVGLTVGMLAGWWAHKTNFLRKLIKII